MQHEPVDDEIDLDPSVLTGPKNLVRIVYTHGRNLFHNYRSSLSCGSYLQRGMFTKSKKQHRRGRECVL